MDPLFDTETAAVWLTTHGVRRSPRTLRKLRCLGGGPRYRTLNAKPYYREGDLVAWIEERLTAPMSSTSEADAAMSPRRSRGQIEAEALVAEIGEPAVGDPLDEAPPRIGRRRSLKPTAPRAAEAASTP